MLSFFALSAAAVPQASTVPATPDVAVDWTRVVIQLVALIIIFYMFFIRPQQKRAKEHLSLISNLKIGDEVLIGGFIGKVSKLINEAEIEVELDKNVRVKVLRSFINQVLVEKSSETVEKTKVKELSAAIFLAHKQAASAP